MADPVVALHGFSDAGECWHPFLHRLGRADVRTPDLLAHGGRRMPAGTPFGHDALVADVLPQVRAAAESAGRPVVLLGHSLGASTAAGVAALAPTLVRLLVLEDPPWAPPARDDAGAERENQHRAWLEGLQGTDHAGRLAWVRQRHPGWSSWETDAWARSKSQVDLTLFDAEQHWLRRGWGPVAARVRCPTLLVVGEPEHGAACDPSVARTLARRPGWLVLTMSGAGHNVRRDRPASLAALLEGLLATYRAG